MNVKSVEKKWEPWTYSMNEDLFIKQQTSWWCVFKKAISSWMAVICRVRSDLEWVRSPRTFWSPAMSASTDRRMACSASYLKHKKEMFIIIGWQGGPQTHPVTFFPVMMCWTTAAFLKNTHANTVPENYLMKLLKSRRDKTHLTLKSSVASLALSMLSTTPPLIPIRAIILQQEQEKLKFRPWTTTN